MNNIIKIIFLMILSIGIGESYIPTDRSAHTSVLVGNRIYFFGGNSPNSPKKSLILDQILYLDVSKPFNIENPPFEESPVSMPFGNDFATSLFSPQKNLIYLFGGDMVDVNTDLDSFKSVLNTYNLETNQWDIPKTNGIIPEKRKEAYGVIDEAGKFYFFGGTDINFFNDMFIFDTVTSTWSKGSTINAPLPRVDYTATLLPNGVIVYIGGREDPGVNISATDVNMSQLSLYDTKADTWSLMTTRGKILENRNAHSAVLTPDERIIVFGGEKLIGGGSVKDPIAVLDTKPNPYEWSIPTVTAQTFPPTLILHSATLVGNYMFINFGNNSYPVSNTDEIYKPFFFILDTRNFTWVTQFDPKQASTSSSSFPASPSAGPSNQIQDTSNNSKKIGIIVGVVGVIIGVGTVVGYFGYKSYKKRQYYNSAIPTAGTVEAVHN